jgi:hypothetical protein
LPDSPAPRCAASLSRPALWAGPFGGVDPPEHCAASWSYSSNHNPLGNCIGARPETGLGPDSARTRFLMSRLAAQLLCRKTGSAATPSRGTGDICLRTTRVAEGRTAPVAVRLSPVARDYTSRASGRFLMPPGFAREPRIIELMSAKRSPHRLSVLFDRLRHEAS